MGSLPVLHHSMIPDPVPVEGLDVLHRGLHFPICWAKYLRSDCSSKNRALYVGALGCGYDFYSTLQVL